MTIQHWSDRIWVVQLADEPALSEELGAAMVEAEKTEPMPDIVLDLSQIRMINSSNLAQMLRMRKMAIDRDAKLRIAGPNDAVWAVMLTTALDKVFQFAEDVPTALARLQMEDS